MSRDATRAPVSPDDARRQAHDILRGRRYNPRAVPRPLRSVLDWIGDRLAPIGHFLSSAVHRVPSSLRPLTWVVLVAVLALIVFLVARTVRERVAPRRERDTHADAALDGLDADALEAAATDAFRRGDYELAVRLRFRAGLLRLDTDAHAIEYRASIPNGRVRTVLGSDRFDDLADTFEVVTYGDQPATVDEARTAEQRWPEVVREARR